MSDKSEIEAIRAVKRYKNTILMGENGPSDYLTEASNGDWVQATDYDALRASSVDWADYAALEARVARLEGALTNAADTFHDLEWTLNLLRRQTSAAACKIAEDGCRAALAEVKP